MKKTGLFLTIIFAGLLLFSNCAGLRINTEFKNIGIDFGNKDSILRLEKNPTFFKFWVNWRPIELLMVKEEKKIAKKILKIENNEDNRFELYLKIERFIEWFWERRDDNAYDDVNEFKENFYNRVVEAQTRFATEEDAQYKRRCKYGAGYQTDMGLFYILLGERDYWEHHTISELITSGGGRYRGSALGPQEIEIWFYYDIPEEYDGFEFQNGVAYIIFEKDHAWEFVNEWAYNLTQGYLYYDPYGFIGLGYGNYQTGVYTNFLRAVAESYIYDEDLEFEDIN